LITSRTFFFFSLLLIPILFFGQTSIPYDPSQFLKAKKIMIIAPHPDDEILGFAGVIYAAIQSGKEVKVTIVTNGDGYGSACYFWKNGFPREDTLNKGKGCSPEELEKYGTTRISESRKALKILGVDSLDVIFLGYPDGYIGDMLIAPDSVFKGNTSRHLSYTGKSFSGKNLKQDLKSLFILQSDEEVYTTHIKDAHDDHAAVAGFIEQARKELVEKEIIFPVFWTFIHEPGGDNNLWPPPRCNWTFVKGQMLIQRENRYTPWRVLTSPVIADQPGYFFLSEALWTETKEHAPLMREAMDEFQTGIGQYKSDGQPVNENYKGWMDRNGYLLSFIKRNHLFWEAPFPCISKEIDGPCKRTLSIYPVNVAVEGTFAAGAEGNCSCQSELFPESGITVGSGIEPGISWYYFGPVYSDSVTVKIKWSDNSWKEDQKMLEIFNWKTLNWEQIHSFTANDCKVHTDQFTIRITPELIGSLHQVRIGFSGSKNARAHLSMIEVMLDQK
jgi:LmbE family N-acetylglucosaminyl deacetylase